METQLKNFQINQEKEEVFTHPAMVNLMKEGAYYYSYKSTRDGWWSTAKIKNHTAHGLLKLIASFQGAEDWQGDLIPYVNTAKENEYKAMTTASIKGVFLF